MGVTITATKAKCDFDMGYGGFSNLRKNIALSLDKEFGDSYVAWVDSYINGGDFEWKAKLSERIINKKCLDDEYKDVLDFLYMSDTEGKIDYKTCRKIVKLLEKRLPELKEKSFRYAAHAGNDYEDFVKFLKDCVKYHRNMRWF